MKTEVSILHHAYPADARDVVTEKLQSVAKYFTRTHSVRAFLERQHDVHRVELVAQVPRGQVLVIDARAETFGKAVDEAVGRLSRSLANYKDKLIRGARRGSQR